MSERRPALPKAAAMTLALLVLQSCDSYRAACFTKEMKGDISYAYDSQLTAPVSGVVVVLPEEGDIFEPAVVPEGTKDDYLVYSNQPRKVLAFVSNESLSARKELAHTEILTAMKLQDAARLMADWQNHGRHMEDKLFYAQSQIGGSVNEPHVGLLVKERAEKFSRTTETSIVPGEPTQEIVLNMTKRIRDSYSDYLRGIDLPQMKARVDSSVQSAIGRYNAASIDREQGLITCPITCLVTKTFVREHTRVNQGELIASVVSPYLLVLKIEVEPENVLAHYRHGVTVRVTQALSSARAESALANGDQIGPWQVTKFDASLRSSPAMSADGKKVILQYLLRVPEPEPNSGREMTTDLPMHTVQVTVQPLFPSTSRE